MELSGVLTFQAVGRGKTGGLLSLSKLIDTKHTAVCLMYVSLGQIVHTYLVANYKQEFLVVVFLWGLLLRLLSQCELFDSMDNQVFHACTFVYEMFKL